MKEKNSTFRDLGAKSTDAERRERAELIFGDAYKDLDDYDLRAELMEERKHRKDAEQTQEEVDEYCRKQANAAHDPDNPNLQDVDDVENVSFEYGRVDWNFDDSYIYDF